MASYSSLVKEVLPYVPFCPDTLVESNLRSATIEFCERSKAFVLDIDPINTIAGVNMTLIYLQVQRCIKFY